MILAAGEGWQVFLTSISLLLFLHHSIQLHPLLCSTLPPAGGDINIVREKVMRLISGSSHGALYEAACNYTSFGMCVSERA